MYAHDGRAMDVLAWTTLADLMYLDSRDEEFTALRKERDQFYGKLGVVGPFEACFGKETKYTVEVASVWAAQFHRLGYLELQGYPRAAWEALATEVPTLYDQQDVRRSQVVARHGEPTLAVGKDVLCYAPDDLGQWIFFDFFHGYATKYVEGKGRFEWSDEYHDPLLRNVRLPAPTFAEGLVLTLYGKVLRWGTGWWLDHPSRDTSPEREAIASKLRSIADREPSDPRNYGG